MVTRIDLYKQATIFDATDITGAELESLSTGSNADALHIHDLGSMTGVVTINHNDTQNIQGGSVGDYYHITGSQHTEITGFFAATDITGAEAEQLTDGSNADSLHIHDLGSMTGTLDHATDLTNLNSANYYHLTQTQYTDLTDGGETALHTHPAGSISYSNATSGLTATDVQAAIDEIETRIDEIEFDYGWKETYKAAGAITAGTFVTIPNSKTYAVGSDYLDVYVNGQLLTINTSYGAADEDYDEQNAVTGSVVRFEQTIATGGRITFIYNPDRS